MEAPGIEPGTFAYPAFSPEEEEQQQLRLFVGLLMLRSRQKKNALFELSFFIATLVHI